MFTPILKETELVLKVKESPNFVNFLRQKMVILGSMIVEDKRYSLCELQKNRVRLFMKIFLKNIC